jgi:AcrR family transcriptional regulator
MVQKELKRPRGRPRAYDPEQALDQALQAFWRAGFSATSLDEISAATGMNRPSLYAAFGDKRALYLALLDRYTAASAQAIAREFSAPQPLAVALSRFYKLALAMYLPAQGGPRGCFLVGTAVSEAVEDEAIRGRLQMALRDFTAALERRLRRAQAEGELAADAEPAGLADIASAVLHSLAVRARAGDSRAALDATIQAAVKLICGTAPPLPARRSKTRR